MKAAVVLLVALGGVSAAQSDEADKNLHDWQVRRLMQPTTQERRGEQSGKVYIYDGLTDKEVDRALDQHFDRMEAMMFVGTVKTDSQEQPLKDDETGQVMQESGGCSN
ncbi:MAG: hypothetical protein WCA45_08470 [Thiobacillaceae bacterium]